MSKKKQRNAFYYFMVDMREEMRREGRNVPFAQMSAIAGPRWSTLSEAEKAPYVLRAKHEKRNPSSLLPDPPSIGGKMDCMGELLSERRDVVAELQEKRRRQAEALKTMLTSQTDIINQTFLFLDIQPQCELKDRTDDKWLPCEMAVVAYSLVRGIQKKFHVFIHPGEIPMGYRYDAQSQSERTHQLPLSGLEDSSKDYGRILGQLETFISSFQNGASPIPPLVFAKRDFVERVEFLLNWLAKPRPIPSIDQVYELELLLLRLDALSSPNGRTLLTVFQATELINTAAYDYEKNIRCNYHEEKETNFCSLSIVNVYSYVMSDNLCPKYSISITPAHLPEQPDQPAGIIVSSSSSSSHHERVIPKGVVIEERSNPPVAMGRGRGRGLSGRSLPKVRQPMNHSSQN